MDGRSELFAYLGSGLATIAILFGLQTWYASYLDVSVVHADQSGIALDAKIAEVRLQEATKLAKLNDAKQQMAKRGRAAFPLIAPKPSDDLTAMSGWAYQPGFTTYQPRFQPKPTEPVVEPGTPDGAAEGTAAAPTTEAAPGKAAVPAKAPTMRARPVPVKVSPTRDAVQAAPQGP